MYTIPDWPKTVPKWTPETRELLEESPPTPPNINLEEFLTKSEEFPINFPMDAVRCKKLKSTVPNDILEKNINSAYPLVHENVLFLYAQFLLHKRKFGTTAEKQLYKDMTVLGLIRRFLIKRAVMFMGKFDKYILIDKTKRSGKWDFIGKHYSKLPLEKCLSYDEIKLSVFLSVSSYSYFINDGTRKNYGNVAAHRNGIESEGVVIGIIGARLKRIGAMEYQEMVITKTQNSTSNGYGSSSKDSLHGVFADFYGEPCFTYKQMEEKKNDETQRFTELRNEAFFDNVVFSKRIALSIDTLLLEANQRAKEKKTTAYIYVVRTGLGIWHYSPHLEDVFVETFAKRLKSLGKKISYVSDVYFSYFNKETCARCKHGDVMKVDGHPKGITIYIAKRQPHTKLSGADKGKLLIVSYAWDGNSLPGNEFWSGKLASSGDSAAAASTQISEIHNSHLNPKVCAENLQVVTPEGLVPYNKYKETIRGSSKRKMGEDDSFLKFSTKYDNKQN